MRPLMGVLCDVLRCTGESAQVTVQLPLQKELPPDMQKCKDKFQVAQHMHSPYGYDYGTTPVT